MDLEHWLNSHFKVWAFLKQFEFLSANWRQVRHTYLLTGYSWPTHVCPHWSIFSHCRGLLAYLKTLQTEILWDHSVYTIPLFFQEDDLELARLTPKTKQTFFLMSPESGSTMTVSLMGGNMTCIWKVRSQCDAGIISHSPQTQPQWIYYYYLYIEMKGK